MGLLNITFTSWDIEIIVTHLAVRTRAGNRKILVVFHILYCWQTSLFSWEWKKRQRLNGKIVFNLISGKWPLYYGYFSRSFKLFYRESKLIPQSTVLNWLEAPDLFNSNSETIFFPIEVCVNFNSPENVNEKRIRKKKEKLCSKIFFQRKTWSVMLCYVKVIISWRLPSDFRWEEKHKGFFNQFPWFARH